MVFPVLMYLVFYSQLTTHNSQPHANSLVVFQPSN